MEKEKSIDELIERKGYHTHEQRQLVAMFTDSNNPDVNSSNIGRLSCELTDSYKPLYVKVLDYLAFAFGTTHDQKCYDPL